MCRQGQCSGVVDEERGGDRRSPNIFFGNGDTLAFYQVRLQRNAKSMVKVNNSFNHLGIVSVFKLFIFIVTVVKTGKSRFGQNDAWFRFASILLP